ncbi:MAG: 1-acyl-sn-glycerol-3-phosphate acyltransferase [Lachnospiraceae bacterium]|nr:1-acyl-sn-glycerol-3-phosphate acyltransferase [Lachnospiraceae bacterium]
MLRFYYVILISIPYIIYYCTKMRIMAKHPKRFPEKRAYKTVRRVVRQVMINARIRTKAFGQENLPKEGGYAMYPNHQGKYDTLGIVYSHDAPCTAVMDAKRSKMPVANGIIAISRGFRLDKTNMRAQVETMNEVSKALSEGRRIIIFPEGGYFHNRNNVQEFMPGAFKPAMKAKVPIVPVALIDSYKPFELNSLRKVTTQVYYLKPLYYEEYKDLKTREVAEIVRGRIIDAMKQALGVQDLDRETFEVTEKDLRAEEYETWKREKNEIENDRVMSDVIDELKSERDERKEE